MKNSFLVVDDFCPQIEEVRQSALASGFGTWKPNQGVVGSSVYEGMNYTGEHSHMLRALSAVMGLRVLPNSMFFRVTRPGMEKAYIHSDRAAGTHTCIVYLSEHKDVYGTGFYRHRATGLLEMPPIYQCTDQLKADMVNGEEKDWEQTDFVRGMFNRALIFDAPLFHSRLPKDGLGNDDGDSRMVWVSHFCLT